MSLAHHCRALPSVGHKVGALLWEHSAWLRAKVTKFQAPPKCQHRPSMPASTLDVDIPCALSRIIFGVRAVGKVYAGVVRVAIMVARACEFKKSWFEREKKHQRRGLIIGPMRLLTGRFHDRECPRGRQCVRDGRPSCYHGRESAPTPTFCHRTSLDTHRVEDCPGNRHAHPSPIARFTSIVRAPRPLDPIVHGTIRSLLWRTAAHAPIEPSPSSEPSDGLREGERKNR